MEKISALLITFNEENNIQKYIDNVSLYANEIIVVDSYSTDQTIAIAAKNPKVKIFKKHFENFTEQRNYALQLAENNWVTFFDADEFFDHELADEIKSIVNQNNSSDAYYVKRKFYFKNKPINFSGMQTDKAVRLFKKNNIKYDESKLVHETISYEGKIGTLDNYLYHHSYLNEANYRQKLEAYAKLRAKELLLENLNPNLYHYYIKPFYRFINHFVIRLGFLDGKAGFTISKLHAQSVYKRYVFLKQLKDENSSIK